MPLKKEEKKESIPPQKEEKRRFTRDFEGLIKELSSEDREERRWAAKDLSKYPEACPFLIERLRVEKENSVREALFTSLQLMGTKEAILGLIEFLRSEDAYLRNEAIESLKKLGDKALPFIKDLLKDEDPDLRIFAINILEDLKTPEVEKWLIELLREERHVNVCGTALNLLAEIGTEASLEVIERIKGAFPEEPYILFAADLALERIKDRC